MNKNNDALVKCVCLSMKNINRSIFHTGLWPLMLNSIELVDNRVTRAADGPLIKMYIPHTRRVQMSPPVDAYNTWNNIKVDIRMVDTSLAFKGKLKTSTFKYLKKCLELSASINQSVNVICAYHSI